MVATGKVELVKVSNRELSRRNILVHPPETPMDVIFEDPTNSIFIGKTRIFHAPFYWDYQNVANPHIVAFFALN